MKKIFLYAILSGLFLPVTAFGAVNPAFRVYLSSDQTVSSSADQLILFNTIVFDTSSAFDFSSSYRYTPQTPGYYWFHCSAWTAVAPTTVNSRAQVQIRKNGVVTAGRQTNNISASNTLLSTPDVTSFLFLNGTTDYVDCVWASSDTNKNIRGGSSATFFEGYLSPLEDTTAIAVTIATTTAISYAPNQDIFNGLLFMWGLIFFVVWFFKIDRKTKQS